MDRDEHITIHLPGIARDLNRIATASERIAHQVEAREHEPAWARRMEKHMADLTTALANLDVEVTEVVAALEDLAAKVAAAPDVATAAQHVQDVVDALHAAHLSADPPPAPPA